jgi:hypothetical protein
MLPDLPTRRLDAPGQFGFADPVRVRGILEAGGWTEVSVRPVDFARTIPASELVPYLTRLGPVGRALEGAGDDLRRRVVDAVRPAFDPYVQGAEVRFAAACWAVEARAE